MAPLLGGSPAVGRGGTTGGLGVLAWHGRSTL